MKYIKGILLGKEISKIGLGTAKFGSRVNEIDAFNLLDIFFEHGGNVLDTARNYDEWKPDGRGRSEECIGKWLKKRENRNDIILCTKGGVKRNYDGSRYFDLSRHNLIDEMKASLDALQTDYVDLYLLHKDEKGRRVEEIVETIQEVSEIGKIGKIGVANWSFKRLKEANDYAHKNNLRSFEVVQTWWSLAEYTKEMWNDENTTNMTDEMYQYLISNKMLGMAYTAQCKGFFQKAINNGLENIDDFLKKRIVTERNLNKLEYIHQYCKENDVNPTAVVNGYITDNLLDGIAVVSCSTSEQLKEILEWSDYHLDEKAINDLDHI